MAFISATTINETSPYKVTQVDELSVAFVTQYGVSYIVGFYKDIFIYDDNGYYLYVVDQSQPQQKDPLLAQTIATIIEDLFRHTSNSAMIYICDVNDCRQPQRARLFQIWFANAAMSAEYTLDTYTNTDEKGVEYYYGLIVRKDNPEHNTIVQLFYDFLKDY